MTSLPSGVSRREFNGQQRLATRGDPIGDEPTTNGWRAWDSATSKVAAMLDRDMAIGLAPGQRVLYLGAAAGTTVSHLADIVDVVYAVEFAPRPVRDLLAVADSRAGVIPLVKDARQPDSYAHVVESGLDLLFQDVATREQTSVAIANRRFLAADGRLVCALKARSIDVTREPEAVFETARAELGEAYEILAAERLDPLHRDHLAVVARPRPNDEHEG